MELEPVSVKDIPCTDLKGVTTVELAEMLHVASELGLDISWMELTKESRHAYYCQAAMLIRDWPK